MDQTRKIEVVDFQQGDYDRLVDLWEKSGLSYKPKGRDSRLSIEREVNLDCNRFLFAKFQGNYIGSVLVTHDGRKGWINRVAVLPEHRRKGVAALLVQKAEEWLEQEGIGIVACQIEPGNPDSIAVFQKLDYLPFEGMHYLTKRKYPEV